MIADITLPVSYDWVLLGSRIGIAALLLIFLWRVLVVVQREAQSGVAGGRLYGLGLLNGNDQVIRTFRLSRRKPNLIGRDATSDVVVRDSSVSNRHALVRFADGEWTVTDLESRNGTYLNDQIISNRAAIQEGDVLQLGAVRLVLMTDETGFLEGT
ncbi:MAG TPA: FHA domain-containing protein [Thermomicrobiales bacterium]|nr:FHA domain-containing protein [Thermomicrobiales bacterium]